MLRKNTQTGLYFQHTVEDSPIIMPDAPSAVTAQQLGVADDCSVLILLQILYCTDVDLQAEG